MTFNIINLETWDRKEYFNHYFNQQTTPWIDFSSFNLNIGNNSRFLLPIITIGKFYSKDDKIYLPFSLQVHHAVCDGYHVSLFMNEFQNIIDNVNEWI